ncbi:MAG: hypothetical protein IJ593_05090 [Lachnospiraceae bacterium]|nr:hypothetical protein [Lachnospiraceae bacterium]
MANKEKLSSNRKGTIINAKSKKEDKMCIKVKNQLLLDLEKKLKCKLKWEKRILLVDIIADLKDKHRDIDFSDLETEKSFMSPDGGITYMLDKFNNLYPILIYEVKNQGTNDEILKKGGKKQAKGNAVERLGKNVIGFRAYMLSESIFPFVCFGDGCDFEKGSSILDRVRTIAMFGKLNKDYTFNLGTNGIFNRGSYYFRNKKWTFTEMYNILYSVAERSIYYYFGKYGKENFIFD